jgi:hypothetical protein
MVKTANDPLLRLENLLLHRASANRTLFGGSAHSPRRQCVEPSQCAGQVNRLVSMMATMGDSGNKHSRNTFGLSFACCRADMENAPLGEGV